MIRRFVFFALVVLSLSCAEEHPILGIGQQAPSFSLPGVDGRTHTLDEYAGSPLLAIVFTCNHCPIAQIYEQRIQKLADDYAARGVALVAIEPNDPDALRIDELDSSDLNDSLDEMKIRADYKHLRYPYLYDGATQRAAQAYGPQATPHIFLFDEQRKLRYEGAIDDNYRIENVHQQYAREALNAMLAHQPVRVEHTGAQGCSTKWKEKGAERLAALRKIEAEPVTLSLIDAEGLRKLRANGDHQMLLVSFWATWCGSCVAEFSDLQDTYRMYQPRDLTLVTIAANRPDERASVERFLNRKHATSKNYLFASDDTQALQLAFDPGWDSAVPYTALIAPDGTVLYRHVGDVDLLALRRVILSHIVTEYSGFADYWAKR